MPRVPRLFPLFSISLAVLLAGCGKPAEPPAQQAAAAAVPNTPEHMQEHFTKVREVEEAVIHGDIEAARVPARWLADHEPATDFPPATARPLNEMKSAARMVAATNDIQEAARGAASLVGTCGSCHAAARVEPSLPAPTAVTAGSGTAGHMLSHQAAVDLLYRGLIVPVSGDWLKGAEALKAAQLGDKDRAGMAESAIDAETRLHELAEQAIKAPDQRTRVTLYGSIIGSCAGCHGLHGRVLGAAPPKGWP